MKENINKRKREGNASPENLIDLESSILPAHETSEGFNINSKGTEQGSFGGDEEEKQYIADAEPNSDTLDQDYNVVDQYAEISDDEEYTEPTKEESPNQSEDESSISSQSISTVGGDSMFHAPVFLLIDPVKRGGKLTIRFTDLRPNTTLGSKQGNHFISHRLVLECCAKKISGSRLTDIPNVLNEAFRRVIPEMEYRGGDSMGYPAIPDEYPKYNENFINAVKQTNVEGYEVALEHYKKGVRQSRTEAVTKFISELLKFYNGMDGVTSHVSSGNTNKSGANVSAAIIALRGVSKVLGMPKNVSDDAKIHITEEFIGTNGIFTNGVRKLFPKIIGGVDGIRQHFEFPRDFSKESTVDSQLYQNFFDALSRNCSDENIVAGIANTFLDIPTKATRQEKIYTLSKRCFYFVLEAFPELEKLNKENLIDSFAQEIIKDGCALVAEEFKNVIMGQPSKTIARGY